MHRHLIAIGLALLDYTFGSYGVLPPGQLAVRLLWSRAMLVWVGHWSR